MRRFLPSIIVILLGILLLVTYLILQPSFESQGQDGENDAKITQPSLAGQLDRTSPAISASEATSEAEALMTPPATNTPQPIIPTRTPGAAASQQTPEEANSTEQPAISPSETRQAALPTAIPCPLVDCIQRVGISGQPQMVVAAQEAGLRFGQYFSWWVEPDPPGAGGAGFWQLIPLGADGPRVPWNKLEEIIRSQPGSIWIIGNEPDIIWQDNIQAETYAQIYHDLYTFIKEQDSGALVAIAGVGQPTPLRISYLDLVLDTYQDTYGEKMPVDIWTVHAFVLREEQGSWGVGIPPGMDIEHGELYEVADHDNLTYFSQNLVNFRVWMADRGYHEAPLAVTEFGILHPADYGFPPEKVAEFMIGAFDFFANASNITGYAADDNRLVQWWFWYSVYDGGDYPTGNLYDPQQDQLTPLGILFSNLVTGE